MATSSTAPQITGIGQIALNVKDVARAKAFYRDQVGLRHLFDAGSTLTFFECGGVRLMLSRPEQPEFDHPSSILYFKVADISAAAERMSASGVKFEEKPHVVADLGDRVLWLASFRDSENNVMALMSEVPK